MAIDYTEEQKDEMYKWYLELSKYKSDEPIKCREEFLAWVKEYEKGCQEAEMVYYCCFHGVVDPEYHYYEGVQACCPYCGRVADMIDYGDMPEPGRLGRTQNPLSE